MLIDSPLRFSIGGHAIAALALGSMAIAMPEHAFAQDVDCAVCSHEAPYYKGAGGLVANVAGTVAEVVYVADCGGVSRNGTLTPTNGVVATLFSEDNGLACGADKGRLRIGPIEDGGWFWITNDRNSAVGNLVNNDVLDNPKVTLVNPGPGVTMTDNDKGAVFLEETATGRVGILPNILPVAPPLIALPCGLLTTDCKLGDGKTEIAVDTDNPQTGESRDIAGGTITRRYRGNVTATAQLFPNGTGHLSSSGGGINLLLPGVDLSRTPLDMSGTGSSFSAEVVVAEPGAAVTVGATAGNHGISEGSAANSDDGILTIYPSTTYCGTAATPKNNSMEVRVKAVMGAGTTGVDQLVPRIVVDDSNVAATVTFMVVCPSAASASEAGEGIGLVPENPFVAE